MLLRDQDRSLWDHAQIEQGRAELDRALALRGRGPYVIQAAIAALHAEDPQDWPQIAALYGELARVTGSPIVELNQAVAVAEAGRRGGGAGAGRRARARRLPLPARHEGRAAPPARPDRRRTGAYGRALELVRSDAERRFLERRLAELAG